MTYIAWRELSSGTALAVSKSARAGGWRTISSFSAVCSFFISAGALSIAS